MKTTLLTLGAAMLFSISAIITTGHAGAGHGESSQTGGHMDHMNAVQQRLKRELGDEYNKPVPTASKEQLVLGKKIFTKYCTACHGESGKGNGPAAAGFKKKPADFTDAEHSAFYSDQGRMHIIKKGIAGTPMSSWEAVLSEKEVQSVHAYIRSLRSTGSKKTQGHSDHKH